MALEEMNGHSDNSQQNGYYEPYKARHSKSSLSNSSSGSGGSGAGIGVTNRVSIIEVTDRNGDGKPNGFGKVSHL